MIQGLFHLNFQLPKLQMKACNAFPIQMLEKADIAKMFLQAQKVHHNCQVYLFYSVSRQYLSRNRLQIKEDEFSKNEDAGLSLHSANTLPLQVDTGMSPACKVLPENGTSRKPEGAQPDTSKVVATNTA